MIKLYLYVPAGHLSKRILQILLEEKALTPEIANKFSLEWVTELDFGKLDQNQLYHNMEEYLKLVSDRCPVSIINSGHI